MEFPKRDPELLELRRKALAGDAKALSRLQALEQELMASDVSDIIDDLPGATPRSTSAA
jgi:hypothetical protein